MRFDVLIIGSGAGGAVTALECALAGMKVLVLEEGVSPSPAEYGLRPPEAMSRFYRRRGMTPILGRVPIGYVEGCVLGGSTEINSGFWHRTPREILLRWQASHELADAGPADLEQHFQWAERQLGVCLWSEDQEFGPRELPKSTSVLAKGAAAMGWTATEVPRAAPGCRGTNRCPSGCPAGSKAGMSRSLIPQAKQLGAQFLTGCRARILLTRRGRATGVLATMAGANGSDEVVRISADHVFVCAGPTETPALLRASGVRLNVGNSLRVHPMLKVAARFDEELGAARTVMPLLQVKEFWPDISLGGSFYSAGHLAMLLSENWPALSDRMSMPEHIAMYYAGVRGTGKGSVRPGTFGRDRTRIFYELSRQDVANLNTGLARLALMLLSAGAIEVYPAVHGLPVLRSELDALRLLDEPLNSSRLSLTTVHAFASCPAGERRDRCAVDSFGRVYGFENLYVNDASMLPDSPGVNPQGSIMALARRNAWRFRDGL